MNTKLTLTIEQEVIKKAKEYAKDKNRSLSDIIENYLKMLTKEEHKEIAKKNNPVVKSLKGSSALILHSIEWPLRFILKNLTRRISTYIFQLTIRIL